MNLNALIQHLRDLVQEDPQRGDMPVLVSVHLHEWTSEVEEEKLHIHGNQILIEIP